MPFPTPVEDAVSQNAAQVALVATVPTLITFVPLYQVSIGKKLLVTYTVELHQDPADQGQMSLLVAPKPRGSSATWSVATSRLASAAATPVLLAGDYIPTGAGWVVAGSIFLDVITLSGPAPWNLGLYATSSTASATAPAGVEIRVQVF